MTPQLHPKRVANPSAKCPKAKDKDIRPLVKAAWDAGWWCEVKRTNYIECWPPGAASSCRCPARRTPRATASRICAKSSVMRDWTSSGRTSGRTRNVSPMAARARSEREHNVRLELHAPDSVRTEDLPELSLDVLQAVEERARDLAFGAVASADLEERTIALVFQIEAAPNEVFVTLSRIIAVIAGEGGEYELKRANVEDRTLVPA
jgi:hypothetical protein